MLFVPSHCRKEFLMGQLSLRSPPLMWVMQHWAREFWITKCWTSLLEHFQAFYLIRAIVMVRWG